MKSFTFFLFSGLSLAVPLQKRDMVYDTAIEEDCGTVQTVWTTTYTTVWIDPTPESVASATPAAGFFEEHSWSWSVAPSSSTSIAATYVPSAALPPVISASRPAPYVAPPAPTTTTAPVPEAPAPAPVAPTLSSEAPSPAPVVSTSSPEAPAPTSIAPAPTPVAAAPAPYSPPAAAPSFAAPATGSSTSSQGDHTGDITYYDVSVGTSSCGTTASNSDNVVALSHLDMNNGANPNSNPLCGKMINIFYNGATHSARVFDTCPTCAEGSLDLTQTLFDAVAPSGDGRVHGVSWSFA